MKIGVIGAGKIGGTIGGKWEAAGHEVTYGLRDPSKRKGARTIDQVGGPDQVDTVDGVLRLWYMLSGKRGRRIAFKLISD